MNFLEVLLYLSVITVGMETLDGESLYWVLVGMMACMPVLSVGICIMLLLVVIGVSAVGWCMYQAKQQRKTK